MQDVLPAAFNLSAAFGVNLGGMVEPISAVVGAGYALLGTLWSVKEVCSKKRNNDEIVRELSTFISNLNRDLLSLKQRTPRSNSALWAAGALRQDLDRATEYVRGCLHRGYIKSIWSVSTIYDKLKRIREELVTSFQTKLQIIIFDVVIEEQSKQEQFRANLSRVQGALADALADSAVVQKEWKDEVHQVNASILDLRAELKALLQPVLDGVVARQDLDTAIALTRSTEAQTSESEKFFADVLANLQERRDKRLEEGHPSAQDDAEDQSWFEDPITWFEDPITTELMCDPVKCSDGRTYDRWTIIDKHMVESPFDKSLPEFSILVDDINVRTRLFRMFPEQETVFHARRLRHREEALEHANEEEYGDALEKLDQVLQWTRSDEECIAKRGEIHELLQGMQTGEQGRSNTTPSHLNALSEPVANPEPPLPAALVELLDSLESRSPSMAALPLPADSWGNYFLDGEHEALGDSRRVLRVRIMTAIGNCRSLRTILLNPEGEHGRYSVRSVEARALLHGLKRNPGLKSLSFFWFKGFGTTEACRALAGAVVRPSRSLAQLSMRGVGLSVEGLGHISTALRANSASVLRLLYLDENDIGDAAGARHIAGILTNSPALRTLGLFEIGMDDAGAVVIADAVARSTTLDRLDIGYDRQKSPEQAAMLVPLLRALSRMDEPSSLESQSHSPNAAASFNESVSRLRLEVTGPAGGKDSAVEAGLAEAVAGLLRCTTTLKVLRVSSFFVTRGLWALPHNSSITELVLVHQHSLDDDELDPLLLAILQKCSKLQVLNLTFEKRYGPSKFTKELFQGLKLNNPCIRRLILDGWDGLDDDMFEDLIQSLSTNTNLDHISIKGTSWEKQGKGERLATALRDMRVKPELLALLEDLESDSPELKQLPSVDVWGSYFDCSCQDGECQHRGEWQGDVRLRLLTAVGKCRTLRKIDLNPDRTADERSVRQVEALSLLSGLQGNHVLQELDLCGYMGFGTTAACLQALTAVIDSSYRSLQFLGVQDVGLSAKGLGDIAAAFRRNGTSVLSWLALCGNDIGNAVGAQHLADILTSSPTLRTLWIGDIGMDQKGAVLIAEALAHTTTLTWLGMGDQEPRNAKQSAPMFIIPLLEALVWPDDFSRDPMKKKGGAMRTLKKWSDQLKDTLDQ